MATERLILEVRATGTKTVQRNFNAMGSTAKKTAKNVNVLRNAVAQLRTLLVVVASARVLGSLAAIFIDFSDAMGVVRGVTGATATEFEVLTAKARELGATTRFTAVETAEGMTALARAGLNAAEILAVVSDQLLLARVGNLELGEAADIATNVLLGFGLETKDLSGVIDDLAFSANRSNTTVQQLGQAFKFVAPLASAAGINVQETAAALSVLAQQGLRADIAGTGVARILARLEAPSSKLRKVFKALKIDIDTIRPSAVGFRTALENLRGSGLSAGAVIELLGDRAGRTAVALLQNLNLFDKFSEGLDDNTGFAKKTGEAMRSLKDDVLEAKSAFQEIILAFRNLGGEEKLISFFQGLKTVFAFISENLREVVNGLGIFLALLIVPKLLAFASGLLLIKKRIAGLSAVALAANPFVLIAVSIAAVIGLLVTFQNQIKLTDDGTVTLGDTFEVLGGILDDVVRVAVEGLGGEFTSFGDTVKKTLSDAGKGFTVLIAVSAGTVQAIIAAFALLKNSLKRTAEDAVNGYIAAFEAGVNLVSNLLNKFAEKIGSPLRVGKVTVDRVDFGVIEGQGETVEEAFQRGRNKVIRKVLQAAEARRIVEAFSGVTTVPEPEAPPPRTELGGIDTKDVLGAEAATSSIETLLSKVNPLIAGMNTMKDAQEALTEARKAGIDIAKEFGITEEEVLQSVAADILDVASAHEKLASQLQLVDKFQKDGLVTAEQAAIARKQFALEATSELDSTLGAVFPLIKARREQAELELFILKNRKELAKAGISEAEVTKRLTRANFGLGKSIEQVNEEISDLRKNQKLLDLSTADLEHETRKLQIAFLDTQRDAGSGANRAILKLVDDATDAAAFTEKAFTDAFQGIEDAVVKFAETGKFEVNDFFRTIAQQLIRLGTQQALAGFGGFAKGLFDAKGPSSENQAGIGGLFTGLLGSLGVFHNGGSFTVGANTALQSLPGVDNRLVAFKAQDGENVEITPRGGGGGVAPVNQIFNIQTRDADSFRRSQTQIQNRALAGINQARRRR